MKRRISSTAKRIFHSARLANEARPLDLNGVPDVEAIAALRSVSDLVRSLPPRTGASGPLTDLYVVMPEGMVLLTPWTERLANAIRMWWTR